MPLKGSPDTALLIVMLVSHSQWSSLPDSCSKCVRKAAKRHRSHDSTVTQVLSKSLACCTARDTAHRASRSRKVQQQRLTQAPLSCDAGYCRRATGLQFFSTGHACWADRAARDSARRAREALAGRLLFRLPARLPRRLPKQLPGRLPWPLLGLLSSACCSMHALAQPAAMTCLCMAAQAGLDAERSGSC